MWLSTKHSSEGLAGVSCHSPPPCPGILWGTQRCHCTILLQAFPPHLPCRPKLRSPASNFFPWNSPVSASTMNSCMGKPVDHFCSHGKDLGKPSSVRVGDRKPLQTSFQGTCETIGISTPLVNRLHSPQELRGLVFGSYTAAIGSKM